MVTSCDSQQKWPAIIPNMAVSISEDKCVLFCYACAMPGSFKDFWSVLTHTKQRKIPLPNLDLKENNYSCTEIGQRYSDEPDDIIIQEEYVQQLARRQCEWD